MVCDASPLRILMVEDEPLIRSLLFAELAMTGWDVVEAARADQTAALIEDPSVTFDLLVTDIHLPGPLDGMGVAGRARERFAHVFVIYITGRPDVVRLFGRSGRHDYLMPKPFGPSALIAPIEHVSGRPDRLENRSWTMKTRFECSRQVVSNGLRPIPL